jgi:hypothetical protein
MRGKSGGGVCPSCRALNNACRGRDHDRDYARGDDIVMIVVVILVPTGVMPAEIDHDCRFTVAMAVPPIATGLVCNKQRRVIILISLMLLFLRIHAAASTHRQFPAA